MRNKKFNFQLLCHNVVFVFLPGSSFNEGIEATFKDRQMEDLWIPFFTVSTDLTSSQMRVHTHGMYAVSGTFQVATFIVC